MVASAEPPQSAVNFNSQVLYQTTLNKTGGFDLLKNGVSIREMHTNM